MEHWVIIVQDSKDEGTIYGVIGPFPSQQEAIDEWMDTHRHLVVGTGVIPCFCPVHQPSMFGGASPFQNWTR